MGRQTSAGSVAKPKIGQGQLVRTFSGFLIQVFFRGPQSLPLAF